MFKDELSWCNGRIVMRCRYYDDGSEEYISEAGVLLSHEQSQTHLRLSYVFCDYIAQGRTLRHRHAVLLGTMHRTTAGISYFALRHSIVGMSSATHDDYVYIPTNTQDK